MSQNRLIEHATFQWALEERMRLQIEADTLWDDLDRLQPADEMKATLKTYYAVCDQIDILEVLPDCAFNKHPVSLVYNLDGTKAFYCHEPECLDAFPPL